MEKLKIHSTKHVSVTTTVKGHYEREYFFLTQPLGPYYVKITVPHKIISRDEVQREWEENPIEFAEVFDIISGDNLKTPGLNNCPVVSLHFKEPNLATMLSVLVGMKLESCITLELRNLKIQTGQIAAIKNRISWPKLQNIILKG